MNTIEIKQLSKVYMAIQHNYVAIKTSTFKGNSKRKNAQRYLIESRSHGIIFQPTENVRRLRIDCLHFWVFNNNNNNKVNDYQ